MLTGAIPLQGRTARVLDQSQLGQIHDTSFRILAEVGVEFRDETALEIFRNHSGATVEGGKVFFSRKLVEWAINQAPGKFTLRARNPANDVHLGEGHTYFTSGFGATFVCDSVQHTYRKATLADVADYVRVADKLENVHFVLTAFIPQDINPAIAEIYVAALQFANTEKHVEFGTPDSDYVDAVWEMGQLVAEAAGVEGPLYSLGCTINSPLQYAREALPKLIHSAKRNIPFKLVCGALAGATAPVTLAGALAQQNAEILAGITLCQLVNPGCPVIYGTFVGGMDMRNGKWGAAGPEMSLATSASAQLCRMYDIPLGYGTAGIADARVPGVRAGFEKGLTNLAAALCGVEVIHDAVSGLLAGAMATSFEQLVIENEFANWIKHFLRGIPVDEDTLAFDVIKEVGPGGNYLKQWHTTKRFKQEHFISSLLNRGYPLEWPASEEEDLVVQARHCVEEILASHRPVELDADVKRGIQAILTRIGGERVIF